MPRDREPELARVEVERVEKATAGALLVVTDDGRKAWIPRRAIHDDSEVFDDDDNQHGTLVIPERLAVEKNLV